MDRPEIILAPGPTPVPPEVLLAQARPLVYHRGPGFGDLMRSVTVRLKELYRTESAEIVIMTSSGTGGLESAIQNCFSPGDEVFVPLAGFFADRWRKLAEAYGLVVRMIDYEWGTRIRPDDVAAALPRGAQNHLYLCFLDGLRIVLHRATLRCQFCEVRQIVFVHASVT